MPKRFRFRPIAALAVLGTAGAMAAVAVIAPVGSGAAPAEKEYTAHFEPECVLGPGVLNIKAKIKVSTKAVGPTTVAPGEEFTLKEATSTITTPVEWTESFYSLGAREARGFIQTFDLEGVGAEPTTINAAKPSEFPEGLPYKTPVEKGKELTFTAPSEGRTFVIGPLTVTGSAGESAKLVVSTEPGYTETSPGVYAATGKGIVSTAEGYNEGGTRVVGPLSVVCNAPEGVVLGEIPISSSTSSTTETTPTTSETTSTTETTPTTSETTTETSSTTSTTPTTSTTSTTPTTSTTSTTPTTSTTSSTRSTTSSTTTTSTTSTTSSTSSVGEAPEVTNIAPRSGFFFGFTIVRIEGRNLTSEGEVCFFFCPGTSVHFGEEEAFLLFGSPTEDVVLAPPHAPGPVNVTVTVDGRTSATSPADRFTYLGLFPFEHEERGHGHGHGHGYGDEHGGGSGWGDGGHGDDHHGDDHHGHDH